MSAAVINEQVIATRHGEFNTRFFRDRDGSVGVALWQGSLSGSTPILGRVHSSCFTSEALGALDCDCVQQFHLALQIISSRKRGVIFYLLQEGRGAGLLSKAFDRMVVQSSQGRIDTFGAYKQMGIHPDPRQYRLVPIMCANLGVTATLRLMTNNPAKIGRMAAAGLAVEPVRLDSMASPYNAEYLNAKVRNGHALNVSGVNVAQRPAYLQACDPNVKSFGLFCRIASYDLPISIGGKPVWFRATAYSDAAGGSERLVLSHYRNAGAKPVLEIFRDRLLDRLAGSGRLAERYRASLQRIDERGAGSILAIPDDPTWLVRRSGITEHEDIELLRRHAEAFSSAVSR